MQPKVIVQYNPNLANPIGYGQFWVVQVGPRNHVARVYATTWTCRSTGWACSVDTPRPTHVICTWCEKVVPNGCLFWALWPTLGSRWGILRRFSTLKFDIFGDGCFKLVGFELSTEHEFRSHGRQYDTDDSHCTVFEHLLQGPCNLTARKKTFSHL